jgi:plasmid stabilization system protein ParE
VRKDSVAYADRLAGRISRSARSLASFPRLGSIVPEIEQDEIREIWVRPYRVIYIIRRDDRHITAIAHASRDLPTLFDADENRNSPVMASFANEYTAGGRFRYLGAGVKLGSGDRIVLFYRLKSTGTYRAVYGDLTVKDVKPEDLPLPVED